MPLPSNTVAKISEVVPQGPHFANKPYWVTIDGKGKPSCLTLDPTQLILRIARVWVQIDVRSQSLETHSFHRAYPLRMEILPLIVEGSGEGHVKPRLEHYAVMRDELLFEVARLFRYTSNGAYGSAQHLLACMAYDDWSREMGANPTAEEHRELLAASAEDLAALVAPL